MPTARDAYFILNMVAGVGPIRVRRLLEVFGSADAILAQGADRLAKVPGIGAKIARQIANWRQDTDLAREQAIAARAGVCMVAAIDPEYPEILREIPDPPLCLYVRGRVAALAECSKRGLAVVGSRRCTHYGEAMAERLSVAAAQAGWIVVSGLARGIDSVAHRAAIAAGGRSIAVLGGGLADIYPPENLDLARDLAADGALVTEQPMTMKPDRRTFPMRNRIIAGLTLGTVVIEAGDRSGAITTANLATDQGRLVFAVPGRADAPHSRGCHALIKTGAKLTENLGDVMDEFAYLPGWDDGQGQQLELDFELDLDPNEQRVVEALRRHGELGLDELVEEAGEPVQSMLTVLFALELKRVVRQLPGKRFTLKSPG